MTKPRPRSPNLQIYRPQLTSVLSFGHRMSGAGLSLAAFGLVAWLIAGAVGSNAFKTVQTVVHSVPGYVLMFLLTWVLFYHLCNGIRHLIWDSVHAFELRSIYASGWFVVAASLVLTLLLWLVVALASGAATDYAALTAWLGKPVNSILMVLLLIAAFHHAALGLQVTAYG